MAKDETTVSLIVSVAYENGHLVAKITRFGELPDGAPIPKTSDPKAILKWAAEYESQFAVPVRIRLQGVVWNPLWGNLD